MTEKIWRDKQLTNAEAAAKIGLSVRQCYRKWGKPGRKAGRKANGHTNHMRNQGK